MLKEHNIGNAHIRARLAVNQRKAMFISDFSVRTLKVVAMAVGTALLLWSLGLPSFFQTVEAASITSASDTLSNSSPGANSVHTIAFTTPNGLLTGGVFAIQFPSFDTSSIVIGDITMTVGGNATTVAATNGVDQWGAVVGGDNSITFTAPSDDPVASSTAFSIVIGDAVGTTIGNPSATTSYPIEIGTDSASTTMQDSGQVRVAIIDDVTVTASVDTSLVFRVNGVASGAAINTSPTTTSGATTVTTIPFGTLAPGTSEVLAQRLNVSTNAGSGFSVTLEQTGSLQSGSGAIIDGFADGSDTNIPAGWANPSATVSDDETYGHWGITSDDFVTARSNEFSADTWVAPSTTPIIVMGHTGPSDGEVDGQGSTTVGFQVEISALQEAGTDYTTTLRYTATPTF